MDNSTDTLTTSGAGASPASAGESAPAAEAVDRSPSPANGAGANGHDDPAEPSTLQSWRERQRKRSEDLARFENAKAEFEAKSPEEQEATRRKSINPLYWEDELKQPDAPKPPQSVDDEFEELKSRLDDLEPKDKALALDHLSELKRRQNEAKRVEANKALQAMRLQQQHAAVALQGHTNRVALIADSLQAQLQHAFPEVTDMQALMQLQQTDPARADAYLAAHSRAQMTIAGAAEQLEQAEQAQAEDERGWITAQDHQLINTLAVEQPELIENGRLKPEVTQAIVAYSDAVGVTRDELVTWYSNPANRDSRVQRMLLDAAMYHKAKTKVKDAVRAPMPPVVKPGEPGGGKQSPNAGKIAELESIARQAGGLTIRQAAKLNQLKRDRG
jgi:hypothetical protein